MIGKKFYKFDGYKYHIVNIFSDKGEEVITYKCWLKRKRRWHFETEYKETFLIGFDHGWKWAK